MNTAAVYYGNTLYRINAKTYEILDYSQSATRYNISLEIHIDDTEKYKLEYVLEVVHQFLGKLDAAEQHEDTFHFEEASRTYEAAAEIISILHQPTITSDCYAFAAIMKEKTEKWRYISYLWYKAGTSTGLESMQYKDYNGLFHSYPTISFEKWNKLTIAEKKARALQYSAYSEDNYNGPSDSYWIYEQATQAYKDAQNYSRMVECLIATTNRYIRCYNNLPDKYIHKWQEILQNTQIVNDHLDTIIIAFEEIYKNMNRYESDKARFFYLEAKKMQAKKHIAQKQYCKALKMILWRFISDYNTNVWKIITLTAMIVLVVFPWLFTHAGTNWSFVESIRTSINVFLGFEHIKANSLFLYGLGVLETIFSYFILVIISTYVIAKAVKNLN